jgi:thiol peroxidase
MARSGVITFKGNPMTLAGAEVVVGDTLPDFTTHFFADGLQTLTNADLAGKPTLLSIVPSIDTGVCATQTKKFNESLGAMGDSINAVIVSRDLPFAMNRFCGAESIASLKSGSDYQNGNFGHAMGLTIEELKLLTRAVYVTDSTGKVTYCEIVPEVTDEPNYDAAIAALKELV